MTRLNIFWMRVAWLSLGPASSGQLNGKRPMSSTYSVTPHDLQQDRFLCEVQMRQFRKQFLRHGVVRPAENEAAHEQYIQRHAAVCSETKGS